MNTYKVINNNPFNVGIHFANEANREVTIRANSFAMLSENDILYADSVSNLFSNGTLYVEDEELMNKMGYVEKNPNTISEEDIQKIFKMSMTKMKTELEKITAKHAIDKIIETAKKSDLSQSKLKLIKDIFGVDIFEELGQEIV
ncbi:hypothetical protein [Bacillus smithii]|uniref:hypothetical protein n=1 Tax=Bacillus smithii TaxID=1479 RepID=UPI002E1F5349|nr:hypothetical protein [Bacillus smithii]MED4929120.1 hypothetical protein [Bacillus smithii]